MILSKLGAFLDPKTNVIYVPWKHFKHRDLWLVQVIEDSKVKILNVLSETPKTAVEKAKLSYRKDEPMDKKIKRLIKDTKGIEKKEVSLLKEDKKHDKVIDRAKKKIKKRK